MYGIGMACFCYKPVKAKKDSLKIKNGKLYLFRIERREVRIEMLSVKLPNFSLLLLKFED